MKVLVICQYFHPEEFKVNELVEGLVEAATMLPCLQASPPIPVDLILRGIAYGV